MSATHSNAGYVGRWLGRVWRWIVRQEIRTSHWMVGKGMSPVVAQLLLWVVKLAVVAVLLYAAFWLALVIAVALVAAAFTRDANQHTEPSTWLAKDPDDHREDLFYHPLSYNDDPDPRFYDPRIDDK